MCPHLTTLINLTTDPTTDDGLNAIFNCIFNDDLTIAPNSEIALQSVSLNKALNFLDINDHNLNTTIKFKFQADTERTVNLDHQILTKSNVLAFFQRLQNLMNKELRIATPAEYGGQVTIGINASDKVFFQLKQEEPIGFNDNEDPDIFLEFNNIDISGTVLEGEVQNQNDFIRGGNFGFCGLPFTKSCGQFRGRVLEFQNADPAYVTGLFMGLLETTPDNLQDLKNRDNIDFDSFDFAIRTNADNLHTSNYQIKTSSAGYVDSGQAPFKVNRADTVNNDVISFDVEDGKIKFRLYTSEAGGTTHTLATVDYPRSTEDNLRFKNYICLVALLDDNRTVAFDVVQMSQEYTGTENENLNFHKGSTSLAVGATPIPNPDLNETVHQLTFPNLEFANFFGFQNVIQNEEGLATDEGNFKANTLFSNVLSTNTYLIELLNLPLNSYNSIQKGRRNILAPIPISERVVSNTGQIQYEPNNIIYLSLRNKYPITLRNLRARILSHDLTEIRTEGQAELNLILKEDKEEVEKMNSKNRM